MIVNKVKKFLLRKYSLLVFLIFLATRFYILFHPPGFYSDVKTYYEKYANIWYYGLPPYTHHLFEYPPLSVPLLLIPLLLDQAGIGKYYLNYRFEFFLIDTAFFIFLLLSLKKLKWQKQTKAFILLLYITLTTLAKNFLYEGIDLAFASAIASSFLSFLWLKKKSFAGKVLRWTLFWASTAIKFLTLPLALPLFLVDKSKNLKKDILAIFLGFLLIWGIPLLIFRSSLSVSFVYNLSRPIKYSSFPNHIILWANLFTHTEQQNEMAPDFEYMGPVSNIVTKINKIVFPLVMLGFLAWSSIKIVKKRLKKPEEKLFLILKHFLIYLFLLFLSAKIFSQPFHLWYLAPVCLLLPNLKKKARKWVILQVVFLLLLDTTNLLHLPQEVFSPQIYQLLVNIRGTLGFAVIFSLLLLFKKQKLAKTIKK